MHVLHYCMKKQQTIGDRVRSVTGPLIGQVCRFSLCLMSSVPLSLMVNPESSRAF